MMKRSWIQYGVGTLILVGLLVMGGVYGYWLNQPISLEDLTYIRVETGMTGRDVGNLLRDREVIGDVEEFRWALWFLRAERDLRTGRIRLKPPMSRWKLVSQLTRDKPQSRMVTIKEGWPSWRIYRKLSDQLDYDVQRFESLHKNEEFLDRLNIPSHSLEGYLFPETYKLSYNLTPKQILEILVDRFNRVAGELDLINKAKNHELSFDQLVTLASIIQREGRVKQEFPKISGVFHSRLDRGMLLQADPTVLYGFKDFSRELSSADLNLDSPYNTYRRTGLPPGPICNPGKLALRAAANPTDGSYLYFVARGDGSGTHIFSNTLEEHREAVQQYRSSHEGE